MTKNTERYCTTKNCLNFALKGRLKCSKCRARKQREQNPATVAFHKMKHKAKVRGIAFTLTLDEFKEFCADNNYLNLRGLGAEDYTVDRPNEKEGYHKDNIQIMQRGANTQKYYKHLKSGGNWVGLCPKQPGDPF